MSEDARKKVDVKPDKTVLKALSQGGLLGGTGEVMVDVKDGKILRIRPFHYDWKYDPETFRPWKIERNGHTLEPGIKSRPAPYATAYKKRTYSPNRIMYPIKRVDWDPKGERNPQNRGISKYERISWEEATDIIASEIRRIQKTYGLNAILLQADGHGESKTIHTPHGHNGRLMDVMGGFTLQVRQPDSWEGWYWGSKHVWGHGFQGMQAPQLNICKDISENCDMVLKWGCDDETTPWGFTGQNATNISYFWTDAGIKQVYICPDLNFGAAVHADKWIPVLPNSDAALQLAIIYTWLKEDTWDKEYVATHAVGMDKVAAYVLGEEDGVPKTPAWASPKCGVPEWTIKALAREFAAKCTSIVHYFGGSMVRGPYSHEPARLECILLGMQGLGGPGVHQWQMSYFGMPRAESLDNFRYFNPTLSDHLRTPVRSSVDAWGTQNIPKTLIQEAILNPETIHFSGTGAQNAETEDQFIDYQFPEPEEEGGSRLHMIWTDTPCSDHLLESRQLDHRGSSRPEHRVLRGAAPVAGERLPVRRPHPPGQHHDGSRRLPHQRPPGSALPDVHAAGQGDRAARRVHERLRDRPRCGRQARPEGEAHPRQDHRGPAEGGLRVHVRPQLHDLGGVQGEEVRRLSDG